MKIKGLKKKKEKKIPHHIGFLQTIRSLKIDRVHSIDGKVKSGEYEMLERLRGWSSRNFTDDFKLFYNELKKYVKSYTEVIHHRDVIWKILEGWLKRKSLIMEVVYDMLRWFVKDCRGDAEFVVFFREHMFRNIVQSLKPGNEKSIELVFSTVGYVFHYLRGDLIDNLGFYFSDYLYFLGHKHFYIRDFAAQSFGYLINQVNKDVKSNSMSEFMDVVFQKLRQKNSQELFDGIALLFFQTMKGGFGSLRKGVSNLFALLFQKLAESEGKTGHYYRYIFLMIEKVITLTIQHIRHKDTAKPLWESFAEQSQRCLENKSPFQSKHFLALTLSLLRNVNKIDEPNLHIILKHNLNEDSFAYFDEETFFQLGKVVCRVYTKFSNKCGKLFPDVNFSMILSMPLRCVYSFYAEIHPVLNETGTGIFDLKTPPKIVDQHILKESYLTISFCLSSNSFPWSYSEKIESQVLQILNSSEDSLLLLGGLKFLNAIPSSAEYTEWIKANVSKYFSIAKSDGKDIDFLLIGELLRSLRICGIIDFHSDVETLVLNFGDQLTILPSLADYFEQFGPEMEISNVHQFLLSPIFRRNLSSKESQKRLHTLTILTSLQYKDDHHRYGVTILNHLHKIEKCGSDFHEVRRRDYEITKLVSYITKHPPQRTKKGKAIDPKIHIFFELMHKFVMGSFHMKFNVTDSTKRISYALLQLEPHLWWKDVFEKAEVLQATVLNEMISKNDSKGFLPTYDTADSKMKLKLSDYHDAFEFPQFTLDNLNFMQDDTEYASNKRYFDILWAMFSEKKNEIVDSGHSGDILKLFSQFNDIYCTNLNQRIIKKVKAGSYLEGMLLSFLEYFSYMPLQLIRPFEDYLLGLMCCSNRKIQFAALKVIEKFKLPWHTPYVVLIRRILSAESLSTISIEEEIAEDHLDDVLHFIAKAMVPILFQKEKKPKSLEAKRDVLHFFGKINATGVQYLLHFMFHPVLYIHEGNLAVQDFESIDWADVSHRTHHICRFLEEIFKIPESTFTQFFDQLFEVAKTIIHFRYVKSLVSFQKRKGELNLSTDDIEISSMKSMDSSLSAKELSYLQDGANTAVDLVALFSKRFPEYLNKKMLSYIHEVGQFYFNWMEIFESQSIPKFVTLILSYCEHPEVASFLVHDFSDLWSRIIESLKISHSSSLIRDNLLSAIEKMIEIKDLPLESHEMIDEDVTIAKVFFSKERICSLLQAFNQLCIYDEEHKSRCFDIINALYHLLPLDAPADIVLNFYGRIEKQLRNSDKELADRTLNIFKRYIPRASAEVQVLYIDNISEMFISYSDPVIRWNLCEVFQEIGKHVAGMEKVARILVNFNQNFSTSLKDEYHGILNQMHEIAAFGNDICSFNDLQWIPVLSNCLYFLQSDQQDVQNASVSALNTIITKVSSETIHDIIEEELVMHLTSKKVLVANQEALLFGKLIQYMEKYSSLRELDKKVFELLSLPNIKSKVKSINLLTSALKKKVISDEFILELFTPMVFQFLFSGIAGGISKSVSMTFFTESSRQISKDSYKRLVKIFLSVVQKNDDKKKNISIETLILILGRFTEKKKKSPMGTFMTSEVIPVLKSNIWDKRQGMIVARMNLTKVIIKILRIFGSSEQFQNTLEYILREIISKLKTKETSQRKIALDTLIQVLKLLSSKYFNLALEKMCDVLNQGYHLDILYHAIQELLKVCSKEKDINIDAAVPRLMNVLLKEIHIKPQDTIIGADKLKSKRRNFSVVYQCFFHIASAINLSKNSHEIMLENLKLAMVNVTQKKILERFQQIFLQFRKGIQKNKTLTESWLMNWVMKVLRNEGLYHKEFESQRDFLNSSKKVSQGSVIKKKYEIEPSPGVLGFVDAQDDFKSRLAQAEVQQKLMVVSFSVSLVRDYLHSNKDSSLDRTQEFISELVFFLSRKDKELAILCLETIVMLYQSKYADHIDIHQKQIVASLFDLILSIGIDSEVKSWNILYRSIGFFLVSKKFKFSNHQVNVVFDTLKIALSGHVYSDETFLLLKSLIDQKVMAPQIYEVIRDVRHIILTNTKKSIKQVGIPLLKRFYLNYPMEPDVLQDHLNFFFQNLMNDEIGPDGKKTVLEMISSIIADFPVPFIEQKITLIIYPLAVQLSNEEDIGNREMIEKMITYLMASIPNTFEKFVNLVQKWMVKDNLRPVAMHILYLACLLDSSNRIKSYFVSDSFLKQKIIQFVDLSDVSTSYYIILSLAELIKNRIVEFAWLEANVFPTLENGCCHEDGILRMSYFTLFHNYLVAAEEADYESSFLSDERVFSLLNIAAENLTSVNLTESLSNILLHVLLHLTNLCIDNENLYRAVSKSFLEFSLLHSLEPNHLATITYIHFIGAMSQIHGQTKSDGLYEILKSLMPLLYRTVTLDKKGDYSLAKDCLRSMEKYLPSEGKWKNLFNQGREYLESIKTNRQNKDAIENLKDQVGYAQKRLGKRKRKPKQPKKRSKTTK